MKNIGIASACIGAGIFLAAAIGAQITHIILCIETGQWGFLIAGAILPPIGVIHGIGHWFGKW